MKKQTESSPTEPVPSSDRANESVKIEVADAVAKALAPIRREIESAKGIHQRYTSLLEKTEADRTAYEKSIADINRQVCEIVSDASLSARTAGQKRRLLIDELEMLGLRSPAFPPELTQLRDSFKETVISANGLYNGLVAMLQDRVERSVFWRIVGSDVSNWKTRILARQIVQTDSQKQLVRLHRIVDLTRVAHKIPVDQVETLSSHLKGVEQAIGGFEPIVREYEELFKNEPPQIPVGDYAPTILTAAEGARLAGNPAAGFYLRD